MARSLFLDAFLLSLSALIDSGSQLCVRALLGFCTTRQSKVMVTCLCLDRVIRRSLAYSDVDHVPYTHFSRCS